MNGKSPLPIREAALFQGFGMRVVVLTKKLEEL